MESRLTECHLIICPELCHAATATTLVRFGCVCVCHCPGAWEGRTRAATHLRLTFGGGQAETVGHLVVLELQLLDSFLGVGQLDGAGRIVAARQLHALRLDELLLLLQHQLERVEPFQLDDALLLVLEETSSGTCR